MNASDKDVVVPGPSEPLILAMIETIAFVAVYFYATYQLGGFAGVGLIGVAVVSVGYVSALGFIWALHDMANRTKRASTPLVWSLLAAVLHGAACVAVLSLF